MHTEVYAYVRHVIDYYSLMTYRAHVLELGSWNINGSVRNLFPRSNYVGLDRQEGKDVDVVADVATYDGKGQFSICVSVSSAEHCKDPLEFFKCAERALKPGGIFIFTAAGAGTAAHNCDGSPLTNQDYTRITLEDVRNYIAQTQFILLELHEIGKPNDVCCVVRRK